VAADSTFREELLLDDGTRVTLRAVRPDDAEELKRCFSRLSPRSRYLRFLTPMTRLSDDMVRYLTEVDGEDHVAIVAMTDSHDLKTERGLGVARFVRLPDDPRVAEAAVTVLDEAQGKGIGRLLLRALATVARAHDVACFRGEVLAENVQMRRLLDEVGAKVHEDDGRTFVFDVPLAWPADGPEATHPLRRLLRAVAAGLSALGGGAAPETEEP
jgi:GNAT superfamily N-acetyltransferase